MDMYVAYVGSVVHMSFIMTARLAFTIRISAIYMLTFIINLNELCE